jgi:hypothetical protein
VKVAAPLDGSSLKGPILRGPSGKPVVKLFIFAPPEYYDVIAQDEVANVTHNFSQLDLFNTDSAHLPKGLYATGALPSC